MSKYNSGDKFVIEVDTAFGLMSGDPLYTIKGFNALVFDDYGLDKLQKYGTVTPSEWYEMLSEQYNKGLQDTWELARKIVLQTSKGGMPEKDMESIFGEKWTISNIFKNFTPQEALAKIEAYEKSQQIQVGDVVKVKDKTYEFIATVIKGDRIQGVGSNGEVYMVEKERLVKTGRHIDITSILEQIRGNE